MRIALIVLGCALANALLDFLVMHTARFSSVGSVDAVYAVRLFEWMETFAVGLFVAIINSALITLTVGGDARRWADAAQAGAALWFIGLCAAGISPATFLVPMMLFGMFFLYTMPALFIGGCRPMSALLSSVRWGASRALQTGGLIVFAVAVCIGASFLHYWIERWSAFAGLLVAGVAQQGMVAYLSHSAARTYASARQKPGL